LPYGAVFTTAGGFQEPLRMEGSVGKGQYIGNIGMRGSSGPAASRHQSRDGRGLAEARRLCGLAEQRAALSQEPCINAAERHQCCVRALLHHAPSLEDV